jgi:hypothetical protein
MPATSSTTARAHCSPTRPGIPPVRRTPDATTALRSSPIEHAGRLVRLEGVKALTMRGLAAEAGCAVGLPYELFAARDAPAVGRTTLPSRSVPSTGDVAAAAAGA